MVGEESEEPTICNESGCQNLFSKEQLSSCNQVPGIIKLQIIKEFRIVTTFPFQSTFIKQMKILHSEEKEKVFSFSCLKRINLNLSIFQTIFEAGYILVVHFKL